MKDFKKMYEEKVYESNRDFFLHVERCEGLVKVLCNSVLCVKKYTEMCKKDNKEFTIDGLNVYTEGFSCYGIAHADNDDMEDY